MLTYSMHFVNIKLIPWEIIVILIEYISQNIIKSLSTSMLIFNVHLLVNIDYLWLTLFCALPKLFLVLFADFSRVMMNFLVDFFMGECPHKLQVFVRAYTCHLVIKIHLFNLKNFIHDLNKLFYTFFYWLLQSRWILSIGKWGRFLRIS